MPKLYYRKNSITHSVNLYDDSTTDVVLRVRVSGTNYYAAAGVITDPNASDLRIRINGTTYAILTTASGGVVGARGVMGGGNTGIAPDYYVDVIEYITITTLGNAQDFGDLTLMRRSNEGFSNGSDNRGIFGGGKTRSGDSTVGTNIIDYITITTLGDATDFGDMLFSDDGFVGCSNGTNNRGVWGGKSYSNQIQYITINTTGNAQDFGDLIGSAGYMGGADNGTNNRGVFGGGYYSAYGQPKTYTQYITINTTGNATSFGDLLAARYHLCACSNRTNDRAVFIGGQLTSGNTNMMDYITISTTGNATDFGDLSSERKGQNGTSNGTNNRGIIFGGHDSAIRDYIEYITINTTGNSQDFGDLSQIKKEGGAVANA